MKPRHKEGTVKKLTVEEEHRLALAAKAGDAKAKDELFRRHTPLVKWLAYRFTGPDHDELFSAGCLGWMHALRTWKPARASFKTWMTFWVRAYAGRATVVYLRRSATERSLYVTNDDGDTGERDYSDEGLLADELIDALWRRQAHGIIDGLKDRRLAIVLQGRMRGQSLEEVANQNRAALGVRSNGREWVRQLEARALKRATLLARASC